MERINLFFLHGFLGRPEDWSAVVENLPKLDHLRCFVPDYFNENTLSPLNSFEDWSNSFNSWVKSIVSAGDKNILVGYSLGGRLALHSLTEDSTLWSKVILISTNPGLSDELPDKNAALSAKEQRLKNDFLWSKKFSQNNWDDVLKEWNSQGVFAGSLLEPVRLAKNYDRSLLSAALSQWSLARQKNMLPALRQYSEKIFWVVGEQDKKYLELTTELIQAMPQFKVTFIPKAGHRVLFDNPQELTGFLQNLLK